MAHQRITIPELLAPAGNLEKLRFALLYGADAVYLGGSAFSLRSRAGNFSLEEMAEGTAFARHLGKKVYLALNIFPHDNDLKDLEAFLPQVAELAMDGVIVADLGTFAMVQEKLPGTPIHVSTQANILNVRTAQFWEKLGARRLVLARELTSAEIEGIGKATAAEIEVFVHGAMCMAYSGRCLMSTFMTGRDANLGDCAQPCRWAYGLTEQTRRGQIFPVVEESKGTFIMNSKDLNLVRHLPALIGAGVTSLKIEGRMKSLYYVAAVTRIYRQALDRVAKEGKDYQFDETWWDELKRVSHRDYTTGFFLGRNDMEMQEQKSGGYIQSDVFLGIVREVADDGHVIVEARNKIVPGDRVEWIGPGMTTFHGSIGQIRNLEGALLSSSKPQQSVRLFVDHPVAVNFLLRKKVP